MRGALRLVVYWMVVAAPGALGREVRLPLVIEPPVIREALMRDLFTAPGHRAFLWGEPEDCSFFYLEDPKVETLVGRVRVLAHGEARLGTEFGPACLSPIVWNGIIEVLESPRIEGWQLHFDVADSNLYDQRMEKSLLVGQLWDRIKESLQPRFGSVSVNLGEPFKELRDFVPLIASPDRTGELQKALDSLRLQTATALPRGVVVEATMEVGEPPAAGAKGPAPPLSETEIAAFSERANQWDAFVTFVVKELGRRTLSPTTRDALLETLLDARHQVLVSLRKPARGEDPVRKLFLKSWERLRPVADEVARGLPGAESMRVLTFVAAGDALSALDQAGPAFGIEISADGLRRMARMIQPAGGEDPLAYDGEVDPALRHMMGFGAPVEDFAPPPEETPSPGEAPVAEPTPSAGETATPVEMPTANETAIPVETPSEPATPPPPSIPQALLWLLPGEASAASMPARVAGDHSKAWKGWVIGRQGDVSPYLRRVGKVLTEVTARLVTREKIAGPRAEFYRRLVVATAWQESCWRQFVQRGDKVTYLASKQGAVGLMQVNERVWRGFYETDKLRWSITYNAHAGTEVLHHYVGLVKDVQGEITPANMKESGRAVYAAYNGGPSQLRRYLDARRKGKTLSRIIDKLFAPKFDVTAESLEAGVASCLVGGGSTG